MGERDRPYFMLKSLGADYYLECRGPGLPLTDRSVQKDEIERFEAWARIYRQALPKLNPAEELLNLGREIFRWLDLSGNWFSTLKTNRESTPCIVEFRVSIDPKASMLRFLEVPWELIASDEGHLAADGRVLYCPVRRIGNPKDPDECSAYRLSTTFMAASPTSNFMTEVSPLHYEEEERSIFQATGNLGMDLTVEESGTLRLLAETLAREPDPNVLHISCHGSIKDGQPVLVLENDEGDPHYVNPEGFSREFGELRPRLLFASACKTGEVSDDVIDSFGSDLIQRGWPAVLAWSGTVGDAEATRFAAELYGYLARKNSLEASVAYTRQNLLTGKASENEVKPSRDWHLARLYAGPKGGGPVCGGDRARRLGGPKAA